jgi:hypothetical protein
LLPTPPVSVIVNGKHIAPVRVFFPISTFGAERRNNPFVADVVLAGGG